MSPVMTSPKNLKNNTPVIKIRSPRSEIKVHKLNLSEPTLSSSELLIKGSSSLQNPGDNDNKINQAWNRLKINALSKAIAMAPEVVHCTIGPNSLHVDDPDYDTGDGERLDLRDAVTSTPLKPKQVEVKVKSYDDSANRTKSRPFNISEVKRCPDVSSADDEVDELQLLKYECLKNIEAQIIKCGERKRQQQIKKWLENDARIKEMLMAQKIEMDKEQLIRIQNLYIESQKLVTESKETALQIKNQELQQSKSDHDKRIAETSKRLKQIEQKRKELEEKQRQRKEELKRCVEGIFQVQIAYGQTYNQISAITKKCRNGQMLYAKVASDHQKLKEMGEILTKLVDKCGEGKVTIQDLKSAEILIQQISVIRDNFTKHVEQINRSVEKAEDDKRKEEMEKELKVKQEEAERQQKQREESKKTEKEKPKVAVSPVKLSGGIEDCVSGECLKWHLELQKYLEEYEKKLEPLITNDSFKKFRFDCKKVVNGPVNAISSRDDLHLEDKWYKLSRLLQGQAVPLGTSLFLATGHPLGIAYCTNLLAEKFVKQGEHVVSVRPETAFAIAAMIVALWAEFPEFGRLLLAHFHRECPYLVPAFLPQTEGQTDQDYHKMLGYQYGEDGKVEPQNKFLRRMSGVTRLYAAVLVTPLKRNMATSQRHPHDMAHAWRWLAATLNLSPRPDISATLILNFLEVTGFLFFRTYGLQFSKLLHVLCADYFPIIEKITPDDCCGGPVSRLKNFLERVLKEGEVLPPNGLLPPNFW